VELTIGRQSYGISFHARLPVSDEAPRSRHSYAHAAGIENWVLSPLAQAQMVDIPSSGVLHHDANIESPNEAHSIPSLTPIAPYILCLAEQA